MSIDNETREAYQLGKKHQINPDLIDAATCGITLVIKSISSGSPPSDYSKEQLAAYNKGLQNKQLDDD